MKVFGIKQCDTCRKALNFLQAENITHQFIDLRETPVAPAELDRWLAELGPETLVNRRSTTWRGLNQAQQEAAMAGDSGLLAANPTLIKRPLVDWGDRLTVGFEADHWRGRL